jgi:hypothetical protein
MAQRWKLTLRQGPRVTVERFASLPDALDAMARQLEPLYAGAGRPTARAFAREIEPVAQVAVRAHVSGPQRLLAKVHGGIDLRGDGSPEAWTGRIDKHVVERSDGEDAVDALRRALGG